MQFTSTQKRASTWALIAVITAVLLVAIRRLGEAYLSSNLYLLKGRE